MEDKKVYKLSFFFSVVIALLVFASALIYLQQRNFSYMSDEDPSGGMNNEFALLGQQFIKKTAAYNGSATIVLKDFQKQNDGSMTAWYQTMQPFNDEAFVYDYNLTFEGNQVSSSDIMVSSENGALSILQPQPNEIVQGDIIQVKGEARNGVEQLIVELVSTDGLVSYQTKNIGEQGQVLDHFATTLSIKKLGIGSYRVKITSDQGSVSVPFQIARDKKSL